MVYYSYISLLLSLQKIYSSIILNKQSISKSIIKHSDDGIYILYTSEFLDYVYCIAFQTEQGLFLSSEGWECILFLTCFVLFGILNNEQNPEKYKAYIVDYAYST
jgi:hypothetical protein